MFSEKAPYVVTIMMAGLAWALTHLADRLLETPMIKYSIEMVGESTEYLKFKNITRSKTFRNLKIILTASADGRIISGAVIPVQPAFEGDQPYQVAGRTFEYSFPEFQPGWQIELSVEYAGSSKPSLRLTAPEQIIYAITPSAESYIVENDIYILGCFAISWVVLLLIAIFFERKSARSNKVARLC